MELLQKTSHSYNENKFIESEDLVMDYKINLKKHMEERNLTLYKLDKVCVLSINTIRKLIKNSFRNTNLKTLSILAQVLNCSIKDLIEEDPAVIYYEKIAKENKNQPLYIQNQVFSPENTMYLRNLFLQVGVLCNISSYGWYKTASVKNEYELSSIQVDLNLRVMEFENTSILEVINFYVSVNQVLCDEAVIKDAFIKALERYAQKLNINEIHFIVEQDFDRKNDQYSNSQLELPADFSYSLGTESHLFNQNNYERTPSRYFLDFQVEWQKVLRNK